MDRRKRVESATEGVTEQNRQIERLQRDLTRRERELEEERRETEKTIDRMRSLEKDKIELKRELDEVRDEVTEYQRLVDELQQDQSKVKSHQKGDEEDERINSLRTTLQERNREIGHFIQDLEKMEEEKVALKRKLTEVSASLEQATGQLTEMSRDRADLKNKLTKIEKQVSRLAEEKTILQIRERELLEFKEQHDKHLENLGNAVDIRVDVWKKMIFQKDEEIERLKSKVEAFLRKPPTLQPDSEKHAVVLNLQMKVQQRDDQIRQLAEQLQEATQELNNNTKVIQHLQVRLPHEGSGEESDRVLRCLEKKVRKLEGKVEKRTLALGVAEKEAEEKTGEIVMLMARLRQYEEGYGLADAVSEIKELKNQLKIRDRDLEKMTHEINQFQIEGSEVVEENEMLRKQLGHDINADLSNQRKMFSKKRSEELSVLKTKLEVKENEITTLKTRNYELKRLLSASEEQQQQLQLDTKIDKKDEVTGELAPIFAGTHPQEDVLVKTGLDQREEFLKERAEDWREKYDIILHENTELRRGLQEILDSFQRFSEADSCNIRIESPILENLLREMSARGLINYPYSISSFHLKVCNLEGKNSQLREELQRTRIWAEGLIEKEKQRCEEWREKAISAQEIATSCKNGEKSEFIHRVNHSQLETGRWKRIAEQSEKLIAMLNEKLEDADAKVAELEAQLEEKQKEYRQPSPSTDPAAISTKVESIGIQVEEIPGKDLADTTKLIELESRKRELENLLVAKDEVIENLKKITPYTCDTRPIRANIPAWPNPELEEALQLARESIQSLSERLRAKEENLLAYKRILAEVRGEMQLATERHVQDINALQSIIHQQQQAFTRMKSTLSHPVRDSQSSDMEGILREQLTRINELEECVQDLEHTMGNVASQLATARTDAHRWRATADTRLKEIDLLREQLGVGDPLEIATLRDQIKMHQETIGELKRSNQTASVLKELLEEREVEIQALRSARSTTRPKGPVSQRSSEIGSVLWSSKGQRQENLEVQTNQADEIDHLRKNNQDLESKLKKLQVRLSKMNAMNRASGISQEMEELKTNYASLLEDRDALRMRITETEKRTEEDDEKKRKAVDGFARWEESKKWKKTVERLEDQKRKMEEEKNRSNKQIEDLRGLIARLEKEKLLQEARIRKGIKSSTSEHSLFDEETEKHRKEVERLRTVLNEKEMKANENAERLTMEARILRERIETQERQLTAYEVSMKGDPKVVAEIQKLVQSNDQLHQELLNQQQTNMDLKLQIQEMKLETPRLRDRVQNLQKLADILKTERPGSYRGGTIASSGRNLGELEKTITALKSVVEKLEKNKPRTGIQLKGTRSAASLRERQEGIIEEKQRLMDKIQALEDSCEKAQRLQIENEARIGELLRERDDAQSRAQSAEMRLTTFLKQDRTKDLELEIQRKTHLLAEAKKSLEAFSKGKKSTRT